MTGALGARKLLLAAAAGATLIAGTAGAVDIVSDPITEHATVASLAEHIAAAAKRVEMANNQLVQIRHLESTVNAVAHGNVAALASVAPELAELGLTNPLGTDTGALVKALAGLGAQAGATGLLAQRTLEADTYYGPTATDFRAAAINQARAALAQQKALASVALDSSTQRLTALTNLRSQLDGKSGDVAAAAQAGARYAGEQATAQAQTNQLLAAQMLERANTATMQAREDQTLRCSAEAFVADAKAAAAAAQSGVVTLISAGGSSGMKCAAPAPTSDAPGGSGMTGSLVAGSQQDDGTALSKMLGQSWGSQAAENAKALGVNPTALAATCMLESNCSANVGGTGTISGAFQMSNGTYAQTVSEVQSSNPDLAASITTKNDPASQSIAASQYLRDGAQALQARGIPDPNVLAVRGYYQFGPANAPAIARAPDNQLMAPLLTGLPSGALGANGINSDTTVGQWRQTVTAKIGSAASQPVLIGSST